jgi:O-antigen ligase
MFWTWLTALSAGQVFYNKRLHHFWRVALGGLLAVIVYVTYFQAGVWKSGWIPPLVAVLSMFAIRYWRKAVYLAPVLPIVVALFAGQVIETDVYSYSTRVEAWTIVMNIAKASPIFGLGFANYYWYTPLFLIRGWSVQFNSHSQIVDIIAQMGLLGAAVFFWFFGEIGKVGWDLRKVVPDGFERGYVYGALGGIVGSLAACFLADWMLPFVYNIGFTGFRSSVLAWIFMGGLVSVQHFSKRMAGKDR